MSTRFLIALAAVITWTLAAPLQAVADSITINADAEDDATVMDNDKDGVFDTLDTADDDLDMRHFSTFENRGLVEFPLAAVPNGAILTAASFVFQTNAFTSSTETVSIDGYTGDGVLTIADATIATTPLGSYDGSDLGLGVHSVPLALGLLQTLVDVDGIVGLRLSVALNAGNTQIDSTETALFLGSQRPQLELVYVPEPNTALLACFGAAMVAVQVAYRAFGRRARRSQYARTKGVN